MADSLTLGALTIGQRVIKEQLDTATITPGGTKTITAPIGGITVLTYGTSRTTVNIASGSVAAFYCQAVQRNSGDSLNNYGGSIGTSFIVDWNSQTGKGNGGGEDCLSGSANLYKAA